MIGSVSPARQSAQKTLSTKEVNDLRKKGQNWTKNPRSRRRNALRRELAHYGLEVREDSKICQRFIGGENIPIHVVAAILTEMDYLTKHTAYDELMNIMVTEHRTHCVPFEDTAEEAKVYPKLSVQAKQIALSQNNAVIIEHCCPGYCVADEIGSNQIALPPNQSKVPEYTPCAVPSLRPSEVSLSDIPASA